MSLDEIQQAARDQFDRQSANYGRSHVLANVADVEAAATPEENRRAVRTLVHEAPEEARKKFRIEIHSPDSPAEKITWWWQMITLVARKPA